MRDADYDDPRWEKLLDQLTVDEMANMIAMAGSVSYTHLDVYKRQH